MGISSVPAPSVVPRPSLHPKPVVRSRTALSTILVELWESRDLVTQFVIRDITVRYTQAVMGFAWALLMPMLIVGAGLVFRLAISTLSGVPQSGSTVASLMLKSLPWAFFSAAISMGTQSILAYANLIGKVYFPRESLPVSSVLAQSVDLAVGGTMVAVLLPLLGVSVSWAMLWAPILIVLLAGFTVGCSLILSCANLFYRDVKYIVQVLLNFGIFATPVFFEPQMLGAKGAKLLLALPLSPFIQGLDVAVVRGHNLLEPLLLPTSKGVLVTVWSPWMLAYAIAVTLTTLFVGLRIFRKGSARFAEMA